MEIDQEITNAMPTVANVGEAPHHHHRDHPPPTDPLEAARLAEEKRARKEAQEREERERDMQRMALLPKLEAPRVEVTPQQTFILIRWAQKVAGALVGLGTATFLLLYQWVVEPAPYHSLRARAWVALTQVKGIGGAGGVGGGGGAGHVLAGLGTATFLLLYQRVVEPAPHHSLRARAWVALTQV